jgi:hypothetical protein
MSRWTLPRALLGAPLTAHLAFPAAASAAKPVERFHDNFTDTFSDQLCGIPVDGIAVGVDNFALYAGESFKDTSSVRVTYRMPVR